MASILKVNTIQDATNSNTALSIDSSGRVTTPARPSFFAYENSGGNVTNATATIPYGTTHHNTGGHYDTSTSTFTAPVAGLYYFDHNYFSGSSSTTRSGYYKNGTAVGNSSYPFGGRANANNNQIGGGSLIINLAVNDTILVKVYEGTTSNFYANYFLGYLIG